MALNFSFVRSQARVIEPSFAMIETHLMECVYPCWKEAIPNGATSIVAVNNARAASTAVIILVLIPFKNEEAIPKLS